MKSLHDLLQVLFKGSAKDNDGFWGSLIGWLRDILKGGVCIGEGGLSSLQGPHPPPLACYEGWCISVPYRVRYLGCSWEALGIVGVLFFCASNVLYSLLMQ